MPLKQMVVDAKGRMRTTLDAVLREMGTMRTGRASVAMLDTIRVDYYGTATPLNQVGNLAVPDPTLITLQPWDPSLLPAIEKAIRTSDLDLNPQNDGKIIRIPIPELTEERRRELVKHVKKTAEEFRVSQRGHRRDAIEMLKELNKEKEITDDDLKKGQEQIEHLTKEYVEKVDALLKSKEEEIMEV
jgi:ribosome recycling factor